MMRLFLLCSLLLSSLSSAQITHPVGVADASPYGWGCHFDPTAIGPSLTLAASVGVFPASYPQGAGVIFQLQHAVTPIVSGFGLVNIVLSATMPNPASTPLFGGVDIGPIFPVGSPGDLCPWFMSGDIATLAFAWPEADIWVNFAIPYAFQLPNDVTLKGLTFFAQGIGASSNGSQFNITTQPISITIQ